MDDVSMYPNLIRVLLARGYTDQAIAKLCSGNLFRVWHEVAAYAAAQRPTPPAP
jgi:membrane dipeptidase